jgi:hypothetical protein
MIARTHTEQPTGQTIALSTNSKFPPRQFSQLQRAVDAVIAAEKALAAAGGNVHLAAKRLPSEGPHPVEELLSQSSDQGDELVRLMTWNLMRSRREIEVTFCCLEVQRCERELRLASQSLAEAVEGFRVAVSALYLVPDNAAAAYRAAATLLFCDNICSRITRQEGYRDWPKSIYGRQGPDHDQMQQMFEDSRRGFTFRRKIGKSQWDYLQSRESDWVGQKIPTSPCLTRAEAELEALRHSRFESQNAGLTRGYLVQTFDLDNQVPGRFCLGRDIHLLDLATGDIPEGATVVDHYPLPADWSDEPRRRGGIDISF